MKDLTIKDLDRLDTLQARFVRAHATLFLISESQDEPTLRDALGGMADALKSINSDFEDYINELKAQFRAEQNGGASA